MVSYILFVILKINCLNYQTDVGFDSCSRYQYTVKEKKKYRGGIHTKLKCSISEFCTLLTLHISFAHFGVEVLGVIMCRNATVQKRYLETRCFIYLGAEKFSPCAYAIYPLNHNHLSFSGCG